MRIFVVASVALATTAFYASALFARSPVMDQYETSIDRCTEQPQIDAQQCLGDLSAKANTEEKRAYQRALQIASKTRRARSLRQAELAWRDFVEKQCAFEQSEWRGGSGYLSAGYICRIRQSAKRTDDLARIRSK